MTCWSRRFDSLCKRLIKQRLVDRLYAGAFLLRDKLLQLIFRERFTEAHGFPSHLITVEGFPTGLYSADFSWNEGGPHLVS